MPHGRVSAELCLLKAARCPPVPRTPCSLRRGLGLSRPCRPQLWCGAWHRVPPVGFLVPQGIQGPGESRSLPRGASQGVRRWVFPLEQVHPWASIFAFVHGAGVGRPELGGARARGLGSPVLLPRVTAAGVGLPQLGGEHPDDVDEEDEVELWERGRAVSRGCSPAGRGARTRGPTAPPGLCSAAASPGGSLGPQVPHLDQDGDRLPLRPCGCDPGVQGSFYWSPSGPRPWGREPTPPPSPVASLLTTMEARMGTWMIHFLFPELKSQHLGEVEASAPSPPVPALSRPTEMPQSWSSLTLLLRTQDRGVSGVARPEAALRGLF